MFIGWFLHLAGLNEAFTSSRYSRRKMSFTNFFLFYYIYQGDKCLFSFLLLRLRLLHIFGGLYESVCSADDLRILES